MFIFAKEPEIGKVKTRLKHYFSKGRLLNLYKAFIKDTLDIAKEVDCEEKYLAYFSKKSPKLLKKISKGFKFYKQRGGDIGERMHNAFKYAKAKNAKEIIIIGSDAPTLPFTFINNAFKQLNNYDIVLGPSLDGGYYLIGLKNPCFEIFKGIKWSSDKALEDTIKNAKTLGKKITLLKKWYDVDEMASLRLLGLELKKEIDKKTAKWTRRFLKI